MSGTLLGIEHMSTQKGGNGGSIINMSSLAGNQLLCHVVVSENPEEQGV